jgi:peptidoglycan/LPS O-acetylase OafA/YrhL
MIPPQSKLAAFDGLRGIAAVVVLIHHLRLTFYASSAAEMEKQFAGLPWPVARLFRATFEGLCNGTFAVWVFWVMSAFVLSLQFFMRARASSSSSAHDYLENAALRRYPRLLIPVFVSVMLAYGLHATGLMYNQELAHKFGPPYEPGWLSYWYEFVPGFWDAFKSAIWRSFFNYDLSRTYNNVLWTMEAEFFGSLFLFSFLGLFGHRKCRWFLYPVLALCIFKLHLQWLETFLGGIILCDLFVNGRGAYSSLKFLRNAIDPIRKSPIVAGMIWLAVITLAGFPNYQNILYAVLACIVVGLTLLSLSTQRVFSAATPAFLGRISFGMYLIHTPIICSFSCWAYLKTVRFLGHDVAAISVSLGTCLVSVLAGFCLSAWVDRPSIAVSRWLSAKLMRVSGRPL